MSIMTGGVVVVGATNIAASDTPVPIPFASAPGSNGCTGCFFVADATINVNQYITATNGSLVTAPATSYLVFQTYSATTSSLSNGACMIQAGAQTTLKSPVSYEIPSPSPTDFGTIALSFLGAHIETSSCKAGGFNTENLRVATNTITQVVAGSAPSAQGTARETATTATAQPAQTSQPTQSQDNSTTLKVAISVPVVVVAVALGALAFFFYRRRSRQRSRKTAGHDGTLPFEDGRAQGEVAFKPELDSNGRSELHSPMEDNELDSAARPEMHGTGKIPELSVVARHELDGGFSGSELRAGEVAKEKEA